MCKISKVAELHLQGEAMPRPRTPTIQPLSFRVSIKVQPFRDISGFTLYPTTTQKCADATILMAISFAS